MFASIGIFPSDEVHISTRVVSSDLAHTHLASGPYGYCPCAQPFDDAVIEWECERDGVRVKRNLVVHAQTTRLARNEAEIRHQRRVSLCLVQSRM